MQYFQKCMPLALRRTCIDWKSSGVCLRILFSGGSVVSFRILDVKKSWLTSAIVDWKHN